MLPSLLLLPPAPCAAAAVAQPPRLARQHARAVLLQLRQQLVHRGRERVLALQPVLRRHRRRRLLQDAPRARPLPLGPHVQRVQRVGHVVQRERRRRLLELVPVGAQQRLALRQLALLQQQPQQAVQRAHRARVRRAQRLVADLEAAAVQRHGGRGVLALDDDRQVVEAEQRVVVPRPVQLAARLVAPPVQPLRLLQLALLLQRHSQPRQRVQPLRVAQRARLLVLPHHGAVLRLRLRVALHLQQRQRHQPRALDRQRVPLAQPPRAQQVAARVDVQRLLRAAHAPVQDPQLRVRLQVAQVRGALRSQQLLDQQGDLLEFDGAVKVGQRVA